ncbi:uncharacterized protein LOC125777072 [Bactrocera dorsalis]|uniref:Uncharacterized protein LOC125777072 n=1 Tax=Bactrocera dorsalis TaxID=27457 RepID=A0ABM3JCJ0_BACDO|nr:uncharacterized protein LOC125777072 [Bactrocera dorsalis]
MYMMAAGRGERENMMMWSMKMIHRNMVTRAKAKTARKCLIANHVQRRISMEVSDEEDAIGLVYEVERRRRCLRTAIKQSFAGAFSSGVEDESGEEDYLELESGKRMSEEAGSLMNMKKNSHHRIPFFNLQSIRSYCKPNKSVSEVRLDNI